MHYFLFCFFFLDKKGRIRAGQVFKRVHLQRRESRSFREINESFCVISAPVEQSAVNGRELIEPREAGDLRALLLLLLTPITHHNNSQVKSETESR